MDGLGDLKFLYEVLKDRPELFGVVLLTVWVYLERAERKNLQKQNSSLLDKMQDHNKDTNELLGQIKFLLEVLTRGRI